MIRFSTTLAAIGVLLVTAPAIASPASSLSEMYGPNVDDAPTVSWRVDPTLASSISVNNPTVDVLSDLMDADAQSQARNPDITGDSQTAESIAAVASTVAVSAIAVLPGTAVPLLAGVLEAISEARMEPAPNLNLPGEISSPDAIDPCAIPESAPERCEGCCE